MSRIEQTNNEKDAVWAYTWAPKINVSIFVDIDSFLFASPLVVGDILGSLLCIKLKRMQDVQRLISTGSLDIHNWIKDERLI